MPPPPPPYRSSPCDTQVRVRASRGSAPAAEGGAVAAGAPTDTVAALARYGAALGMLFQLTDDLLDREQDAETGGNNLLHHLTFDAVLHERETVAAKARQALGGLANQRSLLALVDAIAEREV